MRGGGGGGGRLGERWREWCRRGGAVWNEGRGGEEEQIGEEERIISERS